MERLPFRKKARTPYWVRFTLVMLGFGGLTSTMVLVVLPQRFILQSGLVESGIAFPTEMLPFQPPPGVADIEPAVSATGMEAGAEIGPAERFWNDALPLLRAENHEAVLPLFREYLSDYPDDVDVRREYAVVLVRAGRSNEAVDVYRWLIAAGDTGARLHLARLLRDRGETESSLAIYTDLLADRPEDLDLRLELARTYVWAEQYDEAALLYRDLVRQAPRRLVYRLELAQALYWQGLVEEPFSLLSGYPSHDSGWSEAVQILTEVVTQVAPPEMTLAEMIQRAIDDGDLALATRLYTRMLARTPRDSERWLEWVDFLQYRLEDLEAARGALLSRASLTGLSPALRFRLAQLHVWTGHEDMAKAELLGLLDLERERVEAWVLLGDLYRWEGARLRARDAYQRALSLSPDNEEALTGMREIRESVDLIVARRDPAGVVPELSYFHDSDQFSRVDVAARAAMRRYTTSLVLRAGYRHLDGPGLGEMNGAEQGPFVVLEAVRWWRLGTVRTSVAAGVERMEAFGTEPAFSAQIDIPDASGTQLQASYRHGPAYGHTVTLASVLGGVRSDDIQVSAYRRLGEAWSAAAALNVVSLRGGGTDNWRLSGAVTATREISSMLSAGVASRFLTHTEASPVLAGRRFYWDPSAFWSNSLLLGLRTSADQQWSWYGQVSPGFALARERGTDRTQLVPQFGTVAGVAYETRRVSILSDIAYSRGRAGDYNSVAANLRVSIRP